MWLKQNNWAAGCVAKKHPHCVTSPHHGDPPLTMVTPPPPPHHGDPRQDKPHGENQQTFSWSKQIYRFCLQLRCTMIHCPVVSFSLNRVRLSDIRRKFIQEEGGMMGKSPAATVADFFLNPSTSRTPVFWEPNAWGWLKGLMRVREIWRGQPNDQEHLKAWPGMERKPTDEAKIGVMWWNDPELQCFDSSEEC